MDTEGVSEFIKSREHTSLCSQRASPAPLAAPSNIYKLYIYKFLYKFIYIYISFLTYLPVGSVRSQFVRKSSVFLRGP